ncbi:MAG TPA: iron-containing redox enzyme family protein [Mycobacteriales bacterium]|nr:iron-containing redox enzyme family protein [Mycobacteriales bacterium]
MFPISSDTAVQPCANARRTRVTGRPLQLVAPTVSLAEELRAALDGGSEADLQALAHRAPANRRDRLRTLTEIYRLHRAPIDVVGPAVRFQSSPAVAAIKQRCEADWLDELSQAVPDELSGSPADTMRAIAARDRLPVVYRWLAKEASWAEIVDFLALEGGPDADFDDLVATCQVGLSGAAKMEMAVNYWDEMGNGDPDAVHTTLHTRMADAIRMPRIDGEDLPTSAIARTALGGLLATNRSLHPESIGALGLIELQAGPRCRLVLQAFERCGAPAAAYPFYRIHAEVDPRHGKDWIDNVVTPLVAERPEWGPRIVRGALWRSQVNAEFFADADRLTRGAQV